MKNKAAQELGRLGGKASTEAKTAAVRENGKKGGRPKLSLEDRLARVFETGSALRLTMPSGQKIRVAYADGFLRASTVASQQAPGTLVVESSDPAQVARDLMASDQCN
jgi:hypothetical protein